MVPPGLYTRMSDSFGYLTTKVCVCARVSKCVGAAGRLVWDAFAGAHQWLARSISKCFVRGRSTGCVESRSLHSRAALATCTPCCCRLRRKMAPAPAASNSTAWRHETILLLLNLCPPTSPPPHTHMYMYVGCRATARTASASSGRCCWGSSALHTAAPLVTRQHWKAWCSTSTTLGTRGTGGTQQSQCGSFVSGPTPGVLFGVGQCWCRASPPPPGGGVRLLRLLVEGDASPVCVRRLCALQSVGCWNPQGAVLID